MSVTKSMILAIRKQMAKAGFASQKELASATGIREATLSDLLNEKTSDVHLSTLRAIADACKCRVSDLLDE